MKNRILIYLLAVVCLLLWLMIASVNTRIDHLPTPRPTPFVWPSPFDPMYLPTRGIES